MKNTVQLQRKEIGIFDFHGSVDITDPCYDKDVWCRKNHVQIKEGNYVCSVWPFTERYRIDGKTHQCQRVGIVSICHEAYDYDFDKMELIAEIEVDAGLAGFFHNKPDFTDTEWAEFCTDIGKKQAWMTQWGIVSTSGYGDGSYDVYAAKDEAGEIFALEIRFI